MREREREGSEEFEQNSICLANYGFEQYCCCPVAIDLEHILHCLEHFLSVLVAYISWSGDTLFHNQM
jgi:hypothetical protein